MILFGRSQNHKNCERLRANLRAITCNELLFSGFTLANVWRLGKKDVYYLRASKKETTSMQEKNQIGDLPIWFFE